MGRLGLVAVWAAAAMVVAGGAGWAQKWTPNDPLALGVSRVSGPLIGVITAALLARDFDRDAATKTTLGCEVAEGLAISTVLTQGLKRLVGESRPYPSTDRSGFPSGHTSLAFCFAKIIEEQNDDYALPAYAFAAAVGWSRVRNRDHTTKQALAGALVGWGAGNWIVHHRGEKHRYTRLFSNLADSLTVASSFGEGDDAGEDPAIGLALWRRAW